MHAMLWEEIYYEILDYESKLFTNQTFTFFTFLVDCMSSLFQDNIFMLIKQHYWYLIGMNIPQIVFDFVIY